jgi:hypothetical protein
MALEDPKIVSEGDGGLLGLGIGAVRGCAVDLSGHRE